MSALCAADVASTATTDAPTVTPRTDHSTRRATSGGARYHSTAPAITKGASPPAITSLSDAIPSPVTTATRAASATWDGQPPIRRDRSASGTTNAPSTQI